jgi:hypothetical protein
MTVIDPRDTPALPVTDLPGIRTAIRGRPAPTTTPGIPLPSRVRQARQHRDRGSTTTSRAQPAGHHWPVPIALSTADLGHSQWSLPVLAGPAKSAADPPFFLVPGVTSSRCSIRGQPRDRPAQAAARQCPATILLTGGSSRQLSGGAVILNSVIMSPLVSCFLLARLSTVAVFWAGGSLRIQDKGPGGNVPGPRRAASPGAPQIRLSAVRLLLADGPDGQPGATGYAGRLADAAQAGSAWARNGP